MVALNVITISPENSNTAGAGLLQCCCFLVLVDSSHYLNILNVRTTDNNL